MQQESQGKPRDKTDPILPAYGLAEDVLAARPRDDAPEERTRRPQGTGARSEDAAVMKFVTFFLDREEYGLPIGQVQEINRVGDITRVPNAPDHVIGVINLRGKIVPVIELKRRLRLGESNMSKESRIVVVEHGPKILGLLVDRVAQVLNLPAAQIEPPPEEIGQSGRNYIQGMGKLEDRMLILLDLGQVVSAAASA
jgi:purine-binding chemotaxis protein CheW